MTCVEVMKLEFCGIRGALVGKWWGPTWKRRRSKPMAEEVQGETGRLL